MQQFKSSYSSGMLLATCISSLILLSWAIYAIIFQLTTLPVNSSPFLFSALALCLVVGAMLYAFFSQITYVCLTEENVIIKKMIGEVVIPRCDILEVSHKKSMMLDIRVWGISGLFGHIGLFWNNRFGRYTAYAKDGNSLIEIKTKRKRYVVSCDNYRQVIELLIHN